ncbi:MAG: hypothetical protein HYX88_03105 [Chloroflexi bacterium]|nr:hypothetical protein [Chloroflexota bacterium]
METERSPIDFLAIGHVTRDVVGKGYVFGGGVTYSALTAARLGLRVGVVTSTGKEPDLELLLQGIQMVNIPADSTTTFRNDYEGDRRCQHILARALPVTPEDIPSAWLSAPLVHLCPVAQEVDPVIIHSFAGITIVGASGQGWMRGWDVEGRVTFEPWAGARQVLPFVKVFFISEEDVAGCGSLLEEYSEIVECLAVTMGNQGARVHYGGLCRHIPPFPIRQVDPTGAGDAFAAAFLVNLKDSKDPFQSGLFANCVASFVVEQMGTEGIPVLSQVQDRLTTFSISISPYLIC